MIAIEHGWGSREDFLSEKLLSLKEQGNYRYFLPLQKSVKTQPAFSQHTEGGVKTVVNWTSNDYLGMSKNQQVVDSMKYLVLRPDADCDAAYSQYANDDKDGRPRRSIELRIGSNYLLPLFA